MDPRYVFSPMEQLESADLLQILLIMAGIETIPNPKIYTHVQYVNWSSSKGLASVKCNNSQEWFGPLALPIKEIRYEKQIPIIHGLNSCHKPGIKRLWQTIKRLSNTQKMVANVAITFKDTHVSNEKKCANDFNRQLTPHPSSNLDKSGRNTIRTIHKLKSEHLVEFTVDQVMNTLISTKTSKALGPDDIFPIMPISIGQITKMLNLSLESRSWHTTNQTEQTERSSQIL